jgi:hypothetical protein
LDVLGKIGKTLFLFIFLGTKEEDKLHCKKGDFSVLIRNALYGVQKPI